MTTGGFDPRTELVRVLDGEVGMCPDREILLEYASIEETFASAPLDHVKWIIMEFAADPAMTRRAFVAAENAGSFFVRFANWCNEQGIPAKIPHEKFREALMRTVLMSFFPTWQDVAKNAVGGLSEKAATKALQMTRELR